MNLIDFGSMHHRRWPQHTLIIGCLTLALVANDSAANYEDTIEYLAVHKLDRLSAKDADSDSNRWFVDDPKTFTHGWDEIIKSVGTKGNPDRRLAVAYTFSCFGYSMENTKASIQNMMRLAEENEIPVYYILMV